MKSQLLLESIITDVMILEGMDPERDLRTVRRRVCHEGVHFLDKTLPLLDDFLLEGLHEGSLPVTPGWKHRANTNLPEFLFPLWRKIFNRDGTVLDSPVPFAIRGIRQISRTFKKVFEVCEDELVNSAINRFIETEKELCKTELPLWVKGELTDICRYAFSRPIQDVVTTDLGPYLKHGPGAVAERLDSISKYSFDNVPDRILETFDIAWFRATWSDMAERPPKDNEIPARLVAVPKTASKPRLISIEPSYNQYIQQGIMTLLSNRINKMKICSYKYQEPNQLLARQGSIDSSLATVDLSDASDRVRLDLVRQLFSWNRTFSKYLEKTRSRYLDIGSQSILLKKYASMGSALTFPIETIVFTCIVIKTVLECEGQRVTPRNVREIIKRRDIRIYGDDIVIPSPFYPTLVRNLEAVSLKVNMSKSFHKGLFRESCGGDYFKGISVKPIYMRGKFPQSRRDVSEIISLSSFRDQLSDLLTDQSEAIKFIDSEIISMLGFYPYHPDPPSTEAITRRGEPGRVRWNPHLQRCEIRADVPHQKRREIDPPDHAKLFAALSRKGRDPDYSLVLTPARNLESVLTEGPADLLRLTHHGRPYAAKLRRTWTAAQ